MSRPTRRAWCALHPPKQRLSRVPEGQQRIRILKRLAEKGAVDLLLSPKSKQGQCVARTKSPLQPLHVMSPTKHTTAHRPRTESRFQGQGQGQGQSLSSFLEGRFPGPALLPEMLSRPKKLILLVLLILLLPFARRLPWRDWRGTDRRHETLSHFSHLLVWKKHSPWLT